MIKLMDVVRVGVVLAIIGTYIFLGTQDYKEQVHQEEQYKYMVCSGYWPDYKKVKPTCED